MNQLFMNAWSSCHAQKGSLIRKTLSAGLKSMIMSLLLVMSVSFSALAQDSTAAPPPYTPACGPCSAHRWYAGDGWRVNSNNLWEAVTLSSPSLQPKGVVRCASSAETESKLQNFKCAWNPAGQPAAVLNIPVGPTANYYDMNGGASGQGGYNTLPVTSPYNFYGPTSGEDIVWLNFDLRPNAGSMQFQVVTNENVAWALFVVQDGFQGPISTTPGSSYPNPANSTSGDCSKLMPGEVRAIGAPNPTPLLYYGLSGNGWSTIDIRDALPLSRPANFYLAMWMNDPSKVRFPGNMNLVFKSRYGCGVLCVTDSISQSVKCDPNSSGKIICTKFSGALGTFKILDESVVKATSYDVKFYNVNNAPLSGGFTTNYAGLSSASSYITFGSQNNTNDKIYAEICATYADPNQCYKISLVPVDASCDDTATISGCLTPPTCQANAVVTGPSPELGPLQLISSPSISGCDKFHTFTASIANKSFTVGGGTSYRIYYSDPSASCYSFNTTTGLFTQLSDCPGVIGFEVTNRTPDGCVCKDSICVEIKSICPAPFTLTGPRAGCKNTTVGPICCPYGQDPGIQFDWTISGGGTINTSPGNYPQCVNVNLNNSGSAAILTLTIRNLVWNTVCATDTHRIAPNVVVAGTLTSNQVICPNQTAAALSPSGSSCSGTPSYQWQSASTCSGPWSNVSTSPTYTPPTSNGAYRLILTCTVDGVECKDTSSCSTVTVNQFSSNTISASQAICGNGTPACLSGSTVTTSCTSEGYLWLKSTTGCNGPWVCVSPQNCNPGAQYKDYCPPALTTTTYYRRVVSANCNGTKCYDTSNCVTITVINPEAGDIGNAQTICKGSCATPLSGNAPSNTGGCTVTYNWQSALTCSGPWTSLGQSPSFCPVVTTSYRRIVSVTCNSVTCYDTSNCVTITVIDPEAGDIGSDQTICRGSCPSPVTGNAPTNPGGCSISYAWQSAASCSGPWNNIGGGGGSQQNLSFSSIGATNTIPCPQSTTSYRRIASVTCNGTTCKDTSNCVTITVNQFSTNTIDDPAAICYGETPGQICGTNVTATCTLTGYDWVMSMTGCNGPWTSIGGSQCYSLPSLSPGTYYYKRVAITNCSGSNCYDTSNCVTYIVKEVPSCSITGDPTVCSGDTICFTSSVSMGGASHSWTVTPTGAVSAYIVGSSTGSTVCVVASGGSGSYTVEDEVSVNGCSSTCSHNVIVNYCGAFCTYTQGYYGSPNGKSCDGTTRYINPVELIKSELANVPGGILTIGTHSSGNYVDFLAGTPSERQTSAQVINSVMPGGRTPRTMPAGSCVINSNPTACFSYPNYLTQQGRINNNFFSQLLALSLSANMNSRILAGFHLESGYLVTQKRSDCSVDADPVPCGTDGGAISSRLLDNSVVNYLNACGHNTVQDLIDLANYVIAGETPAGQFTGCTASVPSLNAVHGMCGALNEIFDECRAFVGYFPCAKTCSNINIPCTPTSVPTWDRTVALSQATVEAFPNPYKDQVTFVIKSPVDAKGSLKIYNALGQLISTVFQGSVPAGKSKNIQFDTPVSDGSLFYIYEQNGQKVTGKLIKQ